MFDKNISDWENTADENAGPGILCIGAAKPLVFAEAGAFGTAY